MDLALGLLVIGIFGAMAFVYYTKVAIPNTVTVELSNKTRVLVYDINQPLKEIGENLRAYRPGTHRLRMTDKVLLEVQTTPVILENQIEEFDTRGIQMKIEYDAEIWHVRSNDQGDLPITSKDPESILDWSAKQSYFIYGNPEEMVKDNEKRDRWVTSLRRTLKKELEAVCRKCTANDLTKPEDAKPQFAVVGDIIYAVWSKDENEPVLPIGGKFVEVTDDDVLLNLLARHIVTVVNLQHRKQHGIELRATKFAIHNVEYQSDAMRDTADNLQKLRLVAAAAQEFIAQGLTKEPQEAVLLAIGQQDKYPTVVINAFWKDVVGKWGNQPAGKVTVGLAARIVAALEKYLQTAKGKP